MESEQNAGVLCTDNKASGLKNAKRDGLADIIVGN